MKHYAYPILLFAMLCGTAHSEEGQSFADAMSVKNAEISLDTRTFYFDRSFDLSDTPDQEALTGGGIFKYDSGSYRNFGFGLAYYGSYSLFGIVDREKGAGTGLLQSDGDDISLLGEAYLEYENATNLFRIGRQRLATPLADDHDNRLLPAAYQAAVYRYKSVEGMNYEAGYIDTYSGFGSSFSDFEAPEDIWGTDGLGYVYVFGKLLNTDLRGQYIDTLDNSGSIGDYGYLDAKYAIPAGSDTYVQGQYGYTGYQQEESSNLYGLKAGTTFGKVDVAVLWDRITDNLYRAVEAGPMYSDWQQGYGNYEPSDALGIQVIFHPLHKLSIKLGYLDVDSKDGDQFNLDTYSEFNLDAQYTFNDVSRIRLRYSDKDQSPDSDREDRDDLRVIFYYNF